MKGGAAWWAAGGRHYPAGPSSDPPARGHLAWVVVAGGPPRSDSPPPSPSGGRAGWHYHRSPAGPMNAGCDRPATRRHHRHGRVPRCKTAELRNEPNFPAPLPRAGPGKTDPAPPCPRRAPRRPRGVEGVLFTVRPRPLPLRAWRPRRVATLARAATRHGTAAGRSRPFLPSGLAFRWVLLRRPGRLAPPAAGHTDPCQPKAGGRGCAPRAPALSAVTVRMVHCSAVR